MARSTILCATLLALVCCASAQIQICDSKKAPGSPWNTLLTKNVYEGGVAKLTMTWRSPVKSSSDGCLDGYRIEIFQDGKKVGSDNMNAGAQIDPVTYTAAANPGKTVGLKVVAVNKATGKESAPADVATVKAAEAPPAPGNTKPSPPGNSGNSNGQGNGNGNGHGQGQGNKPQPLRRRL